MHGMTRTQLNIGALPILGRDEEMAQMRRALDRVRVETTSAVSGTTTTTILVQGDSGVGKSGLMDAFAESIVSSDNNDGDAGKIILVRGKFEENSDDQFSVVGDLLDGFALALQSKPEWKSKILEIRSELKNLATLSNGFRLLVEESSNKQQDEESVSLGMAVRTSGRSRWGFERIKLSWRILLQNLCQLATIVIIADDLQWADTACYSLFKAALMDPDVNKLLFVATRRSERIEFDNKYQSLLNSTTIQPLVIRLGTLNTDICLNLLNALLGRDTNALLPLANIILAKTHGNAFAVVQLLRQLRDTQLIYYNLQTYQWDWDMKKIQRDTNISENLVDLVVQKLETLPNLVQRVLQVAALIGSTRFEVTTLVTVVNLALLDNMEIIVNRTSEVVACLQDAQEQGLVDALDENRWKFTHDRVREGAYAQLPEDLDVRAQLHIQVGRCLIALVDDKNDACGSLDSLVLIAARQLNIGLDLLETKEDRIFVANINLRASQLAFEKCAVFPAAGYLRAARQISSETWWDDHYKLMLELSTSLAYLEFCCGNHDDSDELIVEVLLKARTLEEQLPLYRVRVQNYSQRGCHASAIDTCIQVLSILGIQMPRRRLKVRLAIQAAQTLRRLRKYSNERVLEFQKETDWNSRQVVDWLLLMTETSIQQSAFRFHQLLAGLRCINFVLERELIHELFHMAGHAAALTGYVGDFESARRWEALADDTVGETTPEAATAGRLALMLLVRHTYTPYANCVQPSFELLSGAIDGGYVEYFFYGVMAYSFMYVLAGFRLQPIEKDVLRLLDIMKDFGQAHFLSLCSPQMQFILNMLGKSETPLQLTGKVMQEEDYRTSSNEKARHHYLLKKMLLALYFDDLALADRVCSEINAPNEDGSRCWFAQRALFEGLIAFSVARWKHSSRHEKRGLQRMDCIEKWLNQGNCNCGHYLLILKAQHATLKGSPVQIRELFDKAIVASSKQGFLNDAALANELAARYFRGSDDYWASVYYTKAVEAYSVWGAIAKVDDILSKYGDMVETSREVLSLVDSGTSIGATSRANRLKRDPRQIITESRRVLVS